jgi:hypothetical protein
MEIPAEGISEKRHGANITFSGITAFYVAIGKRGTAIDVNLVVSTAAVSPENAICD